MAMATKNQPRLGKGLAALIGIPKPQPIKIAPTAPVVPEVATPKIEVPRGTSAAKAVAVVAKMPAKAAPIAPKAPIPASSVHSQVVVDVAHGTIKPAVEPKLAAESPITELPVAQLRPNGHQPRQRFADAALQTLADSIKREGVMQPLVVRSTGDKAKPYEIVAGERRWRAAQMAGVAMVPVVVKTLTDEQSAEWALVENLQREDLNPIEKAEAFERMAKDFNLTHQVVGERVGVDRTTVTNLLRLLSLGADARRLVEDGLLSMGHAKAVAGLSDPAIQKTVATRAIQEGWSVRRMEAEVKRLQEPAKPNPANVGPVAKGLAGGSHLADLEKQITAQLKTRVEIKTGRKKGAGTLSIVFHSLDEFDTILERLGVVVD